MKQLIHKRWFRISVRIAVCAFSLLVLAYIIVNWRGSVAMKRAVAEARSAGLPLTLDDFTVDMPPTEQNFARQGIVKEWEDAYYDSSQRDYSPSGPRGIYESMGDPVMANAWQRNRGKPKTLDFSLMPARGPYGQSAASFLAQYDSRHGEALKSLQAGFGLPAVRRPLVSPSFPGGAYWLSLSETMGLKSRMVQEGLHLRAEAALATGDSAKAAESIEIGVRLADLVASRGVAVSVMVEFAGLRTMYQPLKSGIDRHLWTSADLDRISAALRRLDLNRDVRRGIDTEVLMIHAWEGWKENRARFGAESANGMLMMGSSSFMAWFGKQMPRLVPAGWFDLNAVAVIRETLVCRDIARADGPASVWFAAGKGMLAAERDHASATRFIWGSTAGAHLLAGGAKGQVERQLALVACEIERHYLAHGAYPASLAELPAELIADPLHGKPLCYAVKEGKFSLYSTGPDGKDDGGAVETVKTLGDWMDWKDWLW